MNLKVLSSLLPTSACAVTLIAYNLLISEFKIEVSEDILSGVENQWNIFLGHWSEHRGHTYDLCWRIPAVLEKASASHYNALLTCTQLWGTPTVSDWTRVHLFFDSKLYTNSPVTPSCMSDLARSLTSILNRGINHTLWRDVDVHGLQNNFQLLRYRVSVEVVMGTNTYVEASTDEFEGCKEELFLKLQNDFKTDWVPKLNMLHPELPVVVQLNLGKFGSGPQLTPDNVSFDVYYHGTKVQNNCSFLQEIMYNINRNRRRYFYTETSVHIHAITKIEPIIPPAYNKNTPVAVPFACPRNKYVHW
ncbi:hypothetical protein EG68_08904 [Paragonimus skrjabini miyazakii]|uniref:Uncharacterized protein n=1 Tax=Paragonimus skrjabini miyazakii TaxID=59628 RepID=A0A8S9YJ30_9TREM|nr:hypothetical protein EG68_08904 [Paragonimus skrjabini miyazakii]